MPRARPTSRDPIDPPKSAAVLLCLLLTTAAVVSLPSAGAPVPSPSRPGGPAGNGPADASEGLVLAATGNVSDSESLWAGYAGGGNLSGEAPSAGPSTNATLFSSFVGSRPLPSWGFPGAGSPAVDQGTVYVSTGLSGGVVALNSTTGALVWVSSLPSRSNVTGGLLVADGLVLAPVRMDPSTGRGILYALNASTGKVVWNTGTTVRGPLLTPPNLIDGVIVEADATYGYVYGWNETGGLVYAYALSEPSEEPISLATVPGVGPLGLEVSANSVSAIDPLTGEPATAVGWTRWDLPSAINGSAAQTTYAWTNPLTHRVTNVPLALVADNGGSLLPSDVEVLSTAPVASLVNLTAPELAGWTTPGAGEGFEGSPTVLGQRGENLSFAGVQDNGTVALFTFTINSSGYASIVPAGYLPWAPLGTALEVPWGSLLGHGGPLGSLYVGTPDGQVLAYSLATREVLWTWNDSAPILSSPALAEGRLYLVDSNGTLHVFGGGAAPPGAERLLLSTTLAPWVASASRTNLNVSAEVWYANGTEGPAAGARVMVMTRQGNLTGVPATTNDLGVANVTYGSPTVSRDTNATLWVNATWTGLRNGTVATTVVVPPSQVNDTPLRISSTPAPPPYLLPGQSVPLTFRVVVGPGGPPLAGAYATFQAYGGASSDVSGYTNASGNVSTTFQAGSSTTAPSPSGITLTVEKAGYELGSYAWVTEVNPLPSLLLRASPSSLLVVAGASVTLHLEVNSSSGGPVAGASLVLQDPAVGGNLSVTGGLTDVSGTLIVVYRAPGSVPAPGVTSSLPITISASGYVTAYDELPVTVVPNASAPVSSGNATAGNLFSGLSPGAADALAAFLALLVVAVVLLLVRPGAAPKRPQASVWEESSAPEGSKGSGPSSDGPDARSDAPSSDAPVDATEGTSSPSAAADTTLN